MAREKVHIHVRALIVMADLLYIGTAGYRNDTWAIGQSYADDPIFTPLI
jgi:hypothetical protein